MVRMSTRSPKMVSHGLCRSITCWSVSTPRGRGDQREAAKDRQNGSSCHGHCKCPFTVHLAPGLQSTGGRVDSAPGPLSALVFCHPSILLSVCLSAPRSDIRLERSHFLSIPLYLTAPGKKKTHMSESRVGRGAPIGPTAHLSWSDPHLEGHQFIFRKLKQTNLSTIAMFNNIFLWPQFW